MDFYRIKERSPKKEVVEIYPDFVVTRSKDLMVRGQQFYGIWDEQIGLWSTDEYDVQRLIDQDLYEYRDKKGPTAPENGFIKVKALGDFSTNVW